MQVDAGIFTDNDDGDDDVHPPEIHRLLQNGFMDSFLYLNRISPRQCLETKINWPSGGVVGLPT